MTMDLTQLANLGEFIGGVAVLVTLVYLAVQMRTSAHEHRATAAREATRELANVVHGFTGSQDSAELWLRGMQSFGELKVADRVRFSAIMGQAFRMFEQLYYQNLAGGVEPEVWDGFQNQLCDFAAYPGCAAWWPTRAHWFGKGFRTFVELQMNANSRPRLGYGEISASEPRKEGA